MIYGIGHSNLSGYDFVQNLKKHKISILVDVRTRPYSKFNPQFNRESLREELQSFGIQYQWYGKNLGGYGHVKSSDFVGDIDSVIRMAKGTKLAIMCSEGDHTKCHRHDKLAPALKLRGVPMVNIDRNGNVDKSTPAVTLADFL